MLKLCEEITSSSAALSAIEPREPLGVEAMLAKVSNTYGPDTLKDVQSGAKELADSIQHLFEYVCSVISVLLI